MRLIITIIFILVLSAGCSQKETKEEKSYPKESIQVLELPFPELPDNLTDPQKRAEYLIMYFWDGMNFSDTTLSHNEDFLAQNFVNFISLYPFASDTVQYQASAKLLKSARIDSIAYEKLNEVIERYLYDIESPMLSEEIYSYFLRSVIADSYTSEKDREIAELTMEEIQKNRKGTIATDFKYISREGKNSTLHTTSSGDQMMLIFYDPDCEVCKSVIEKLSKDVELNNAIREGKMTVLAIYTGEEQEKWESTKDSLPSNWIVGYEPGIIDKKDLYVLRATPTIYLLDGANKEVLIKDMSVN